MQCINVAVMGSRMVLGSCWDWYLLIPAVELPREGNGPMGSG